MKNPICYVRNVLRFFALKCRYPVRLSIGPIQTFEKIRLEIGKNGKATVGNFNQNREKLYIGVPSGELIMGDHCFFNINDSITCIEKVEIGNNCKFGNNLVIVDHDHNFKTSNPEFISKPIKIGNNVWCGANVVILKGSEIGDNCVIAAGSIVRGKIPNNCIYVKGEIREIVHG